MPGNSNTIYMTEKGMQKARIELEILLNTTRPELLGYLQDARDGGDSADNTEYLYLIQDLEGIDRRIRELRYKLDHAQLIERVNTNEIVTLGSTVIMQEKDNAPETYTIVGSAEADPDQGFISDGSPLGRALLHHRIGDEVTIESPDGPLCFLIIAIN